MACSGADGVGRGWAAVAAVESEEAGKGSVSRGDVALF